MGQRIRNISAILLRCAICNFFSAGQQAALGAEMVIPPKLVAMLSGKPVLVATASQAAGGDMMAVQQTRNADTPTTPTVSALERRSISPMPSLKQRRRKPKMASVPAGTQAVVQVVDEPGTQTVAQETKKTATPDKPQAAVQRAETDDPFAPARPQATAQKAGTDDPFAPARPQAAAQRAGTDDPFAPARPQATAQKAETDDPFAPARPQATAQKATGGKQYSMAPIRWRASVSERINWLYLSNTSPYSSGSSTSASLEHTQTAGISLSSYIMQPYIAEVSGGIGVESSAATNGPGKSRSNSLYGDGKLSLFRRSYFPFSLTFGSNTASQTRYLLPNTNQARKSLALTQEYRPVGSYSKYWGTYKRENDTADENSSRTLFDGSYRTRLGSAYDQPVEARVMHTTKTSQSEGVSNMNMFSARHIYLPPDSLLSLTSAASLHTTSQKYIDAPVNNAQYLQVNTTADWQPESEEIPLVVSGGVRLYRTQSTVGSTSGYVTQSLSGIAHADYTASPKLTYSADGSVAHIISGATSGIVTAQSGRASYQGDPVKLKQANYAWSGNAGISNQTGSASDSGVFGGAGHFLGGDYSSSLFDKQIRLRYNIRQSLDAVASRVSGQSATLVNAGTLDWKAPSGETLAGGARLSVTDTRTMGKNPGHTLLTAISFGGSGQQGYGYRTSVYGVQVAANASIVALYSQQRNSGSQSGETRIFPSANGSATYSKKDVFGVRKLVYYGILKTDVSPKPAEQGSNARVIWKPVSYNLTQTLSYRIGMNEARLVGNLNGQHNGAKNASIFIQFMAWRSIGN